MISYRAFARWSEEACYNRAMGLVDSQRIRIRDDVLSRVLEGEAVLLDLKSGTYFGLNEVGSEVWEIIRSGADIGQIRAKLLEQFDVDRHTVDRDLETLIAQLEERGLVEIES